MESLAVVIPVYQGADTLRSVVTELLEIAPVLEGEGLLLEEIVLVHDGAIDASADVIAELDDGHERVRPVWLSRNFGQHAATLAGCASTTTSWVVTMDEDGLHDPRAIAALRAAARVGGHDLVYGVPRSVPHDRWRSATSRGAKWVAEHLLGVTNAAQFSSFRLMDGPVARSMAAYCGHGVYLDVAAAWVFASPGAAEVTLRQELRDRSGYSLHSLLTHFRRLTVTAGARPLRYAAALGMIAMGFGLIYAGWVVFRRVTGGVEVPGWSSVTVLVTVFSGLILFVLGVIAEFLSSTLSMVSGRPPYLIVGERPRSAGERPHVAGSPGDP